MLTVYVDFKSPAAYLAIAPTLALAERYALDVAWKPFRTVERDVPKLGKEETVGESHRRVRAASQRSLAIKYARHQGVDLKFPEALGNTDLALGVLAEIEGDRLTYIRTAFDAYWSDHADLNDERTVQQLIENVDLEPSSLLENARPALEQAQDVAEEAGVVGAPAYVIKEQIFVGREHLPWIEEIVRSEA